MRLIRFDSLAGATALALTLAACSDSNAPGSAGTMALRIATTPSGRITTAAVSPSLVATPLTFTDGAGNILVISDAQVVLKQVSFERADNATACPDGEHDIEHENETHRSGSDAVGTIAFDESDQDEADDNDSCEAEALGPMLVDLPLNSGAQQQFSIGIEPGTYTGRPLPHPQGQLGLGGVVPGQSPRVRRHQHPGHRHLQRRAVRLHHEPQYGPAPAVRGAGDGGSVG